MILPAAAPDPKARTHPALILRITSLSSRCPIHSEVHVPVPSPLLEDFGFPSVPFLPRPSRSARGSVFEFLTHRHPAISGADETFGVFDDPCRSIGVSDQLHSLDGQRYDIKPRDEVCNKERDVDNIECIAPAPLMGSLT
jgi:hypothetical protein